MSNINTKEFHYGGINVDQHLVLPPVPLNTDAPFTYRGVNENSYSVTLIVEPGCGCTDAKVLPDPVVPAGASFTIEGVFKKTMLAKEYTKTVSLFFNPPGYEGKAHDRKLTLTFNVKVQG